MSCGVSLKPNVFAQVSPAGSVKRTSTTACQSPATTVCAKTASLPSPASATPDTPAPSVTSKFRSATVTPVRTEGAASTWSMPTSATAHLEPQVGARVLQHGVYYKKGNLYFYTRPSVTQTCGKFRGDDSSEKVLLLLLLF